MRVLDCESPESTYASLANIFGMDEGRIRDLLLRFDIDEYFRANPRAKIDSDELLLSVMAPSGVPPAYDSTCWFHLTRALPDTTFEQGILPLGTQVNSIWASLFGLLEGSFPEAAWGDFRRSVETDFSHRLADDYRLKTSRRHLWGPYAILIRDIAFDPESYGNHDYLGIPEIVDDICACFRQYAGVNLREIYLRRTRPCVVKFIDGGIDREYVKSALKYVYLLRRETTMVALDTDSFDGGGRPIPADRILRIEFP
jgi:hypothetical protein